MRGVGFINDDKDMQVCISLKKATVDGRLICFYHATSRFVDHDMIKAWIKKWAPASAYDESGCLNHADSMNFHNVLRYVEQNKEPA